ncbi:MarR family winged helix-turn-helix transcriptional regulator [Brachybacterium hainanense]|uniref:MarR family winged helix-turn-helix transcriptional regulator n=1 Tax=Brachybacterium hainanense TaxID=1541174 RepID=A0ABV6R925_9MICO
METRSGRIAAVIELLGRTAAHLAAHDDQEQAHLRDACSVPAQEALASMSVEMLHLLEAIAVAAEGGSAPNVVRLAEATGMPKGTVSKRLQRMVAAGVVARGMRPGSRKEVRLYLTEVGEEIRAAHRSLHEEMGHVLEEFLARYAEEEIEVLRRMLEDLLRMPRHGLRFRPDLLDPPSAPR